MNVAWIDLETTGLDETAGSILEVGLVVTDPVGHVLDQREWLVAPDPDHLADLDPVVYEMHRTSGLLAELEAAGRAACDLDYLDRDVCRSLDGWTVDGRIILGGSGVHFDARWMRTHLPEAFRRLTYWHYDVGVVRRLMRSVDPRMLRPAADKAHRALVDARDHADEWAWYRRRLGALLDALDASWEVSGRLSLLELAVARFADPDFDPDFDLDGLTEDAENRRDDTTVRLIAEFRRLRGSCPHPSQDRFVGAIGDVWVCLACRAVVGWEARSGGDSDG